jgi:hypothetical protein
VLAVVDKRRFQSGSSTIDAEIGHARIVGQSLPGA